MTPLSARDLDLLRRARRGVLATTASDGAARLVPITFVVFKPSHGEQTLIYSPLDEKPKSVADPRHLARVRDIAREPQVSVLVDEWSEEWSRLGWVRVLGAARLIEPDDALRERREHERAVAMLREKYAQYRAHRLETRPMLRIAVERATSWYATP